MKIVIAPDSFKESLSAMAVAEAIEKGFREIYPDADYVKVPMAGKEPYNQWWRPAAGVILTSGYKAR